MQKALLEFFIADNELFTFVIRPDDEKKGIRDESPIVIQHAFDERLLNMVVESLKADFSQVAESGVLPDEQLSMNMLCELGNLIFNDELKPYIHHYDALYIVPYGKLHYVPFHAMQYDSQFLIEKFALSYLPSATVLRYLKLKPRKKQVDKILLGGVDSSGLTGLFSKEIRNIRNKLEDGKKDITFLLNKDCNKQNLISKIGGNDIVHISSHGYFNNESAMQSGLLLAGDYSESYMMDGILSPSDSDYILSVNDIFESVRLDCELMVTSACVTGDSEYKKGDELIGLSRGLLYAGAKSMMLTLFPLMKNISASNDSSLNISSFYDYYLNQGMNKSQAFQAYIKGIIHHPNPSQRHPYHWLPWMFVGALD